MKKVLVAGSSNVDFVLRVSEMARKGETISAKSFRKVPGGKGANQACAVGKLGGACTFLSAMGLDDLGDLVSASLEQAGVDLSKVLKVAEVPTGMAMISVDDAGENSIVIVPGANESCDVRYISENQRCIEDAEILLTQMEIPMDAVQQILSIAKKSGTITILNPAPAPEHIPPEILKGLDYITPNETELETLTGMKTETIEEIGAAAESLLARGVRNVLVTMGSRGAYLCNSGGKKLYPAYSVTPVDTTAAGDTFNAGLVVGLAEDMNLSDAIHLANVAAALSTTRMGAQTSIPTRQEVQALMVSKDR